MTPMLGRVMTVAVALAASAPRGAPAADFEGSVVERAVVRFTAPEIGGAAKPRFVFARFLAFQARLEALRDPAWDSTAEAHYLERHIRAALERHIGEVLLASLRIDPEPTSDELKQQTAAARMATLQQIGGDGALREAAAAEGISQREVLGLFRRRARASLYLDRMVAPMLAVSEQELRALHSTASNELRSMPFEQARPGLERWHAGKSLAKAVEDYFQAARTRLRISTLTGR